MMRVRDVLKKVAFYQQYMDGGNHIYVRHHHKQSNLPILY
ncbi:hypothetical protein SCA_1803 [Staphylococcus carnosus subsp. carnosus TM300]|uniref:Uncharacterized protein n=1 Tax=Staphylococcus carnosus (strain TM300) TaxID=396513 RepID=B9DLV0_STACT|nr:hypothetical protein SCA_1803 [Staphylococcus carnosus subsp. carnosus TM300]